MAKYVATLEIDVHDPAELAEHVVLEMSKIGKSEYVANLEASTRDKTAEYLQYLLGAFYNCPALLSD